jgi:hypothetical protein
VAEPASAFGEAAEEKTGGLEAAAAIQTPLERVAQCEESDQEKVAALKKLQSQLDPFERSQTIDRKLQRLYRLALQRLSPRALPQALGGR